MYIIYIYICIYIYIIVSFHDHIVGSHPDPSSLVRQRCNSRLVVAKSDGRFAKSSPRFPGKPWKIRGKPMGFNMGTPWQSHGKPWKTHGKAMGLATPPGLRPDRGSPLGDCGGAAEPRGGPQTSGRPRGWRAWIADVFKGKVGQSQKRG